MGCDVSIGSRVYGSLLSYENAECIVAYVKIIRIIVKIFDWVVIFPFSKMFLVLKCTYLCSLE